MTSLQSKVDALTLELSQSKAASATLEADTSGLREIATASLHNMQLVLRQGNTDTTNLPSASIVAQHGEVRAAFEKYLPVGRRSEVIENDGAEPQSSAATARSMGIAQKVG